MEPSLYCIVCEKRGFNCHDIICCLDCKKEIASRPKNAELLEYIDDVYKNPGLGNRIHQRLYRFWYDSVGRGNESQRCVDMYRRKASLADLCCDTIIRNDQLILEMSSTLPECAPPWTGLLKAWCRWKRVRGKKTTKNACAIVIKLTLQLTP